MYKAMIVSKGHFVTAQVHETGIATEDKFWF